MLKNKKISLKIATLTIFALFIFSNIFTINSVILGPSDNLNKEDPEIPRVKEKLNIKLSAVDYSNATVVSDGFSGIYWNDDVSWEPAIAVDSSDAVHVVWQDTTNGIWGTDLEIMYAKYTTATGWSNA
ncbi:hypothetical protein LCGC14_2733760, partial [marine sediment metagenome]